MVEGSGSVVRLGLPKGRMQQEVFRLLQDAGVSVSAPERGYRPRVGLPGFEVKLLKPHNIVQMLQAGSRDIGFVGADWVRELGAELVEVFDTGMDPVRLVAAAPSALLAEGGGRLPARRLVVASEYEQVTRAWIQAEGLDATVLRTYGATEVFPPEDADLIVDNTATGSTLRENGLHIFAELMRSTTRLYAHPAALEDAGKREKIEHLSLLIRSVQEARRRVMVEMNVSRAEFEGLIAVLPCMREPTVSALHGEVGYAVKVAVLREQLPSLIPQIRARGGTDIVVLSPTQIVV